MFHCQWKIPRSLGVNDKETASSGRKSISEPDSKRFTRKWVTLLDPSRLDVRGELLLGRDVTIDVNVIFEGRVVLGDSVYIGPNSIVKKSEIERIQ